MMMHDGFVLSLLLCSLWFSQAGYTAKVAGTLKWSRRINISYMYIANLNRNLAQSTSGKSIPWQKHWELQNFEHPQKHTPKATQHQQQSRKRLMKKSLSPFSLPYWTQQLQNSICCFDFSESAISKYKWDGRMQDRSDVSVETVVRNTLKIFWSTWGEWNIP